MAFNTCIRLCLLLLVIQLHQVWSSQSHRHRRSLLQMYQQLDCQQGDCEPLNYVGYGCYCGTGGGGRPVDGIDNCCRQHDLCYGQVATRCNYLDYYLGEYSWKCVGGNAKCNQGSQNSDCYQQLCKCDEVFTTCLQRYPCPKNKPDCPHNPEHNDLLHQLSKLIDPYTKKHLNFSALKKLSELENRKRITLPIFSRN